MKKIVLILLLLCTPFVVFADMNPYIAGITPVSGSAKDANSVFYYTGDNAGGTLVAQTYSSTISGTLTAASVTTTRNNTSGGQYSLEGTSTANTVDNASFNVSAKNIFDSTEGYFECWIYPTATTDDNQFFGAAGDGYTRAFIETDRTVRFFFSSGALSALTSTDLVTLNTFNQIELRWNTTIDTISIKINGGSWIDKTDVSINVFTTEPTTIQIGSYDTVHGLFGSIDDVQIWRKYDKTY